MPIPPPGSVRETARAAIEHIRLRWFPKHRRSRDMVPEPSGSNLLVYDRFSNTDELSQMVSDQLAKLRDPTNRDSNLFLLSWTLTQTFAQSVACITGAAPSVLDLASKANNALWSTITTTYEDRTTPISLLPNLTRPALFGLQKRFPGAFGAIF
jgi:hypothetical protein